MVGQSITAAADKFQLVERLLNGDALANWKQSKTTRRAITDAAFSFCKKSLLAHVFPPMALKKQKKYLRSGIKKPRGQRIREFDARRMELMAYMEEFPDWEEGKGFDEDEQKELMEKAIPNSWYQQCHLHNIIDPGKTIIDLIEFCERIEIAEAVAQQNGVSTPTNQSKKNCKRAESQTEQNAGNKDPQMDAKTSERGKTKGTKKESNTSKWCELHDTTSHDMNGCKVMIAQAKKMKAAWKAQNPQTRKNNSKKEKKDRDTKSFSKEEVNAMISQAVTAALEHTAKQKSKRKRST